MSGLGDVTHQCMSDAAEPLDPQAALARCMLNAGVASAEDTGEGGRMPGDISW